MLRPDAPPHSPAEAAFWALRAAYSSRCTAKLAMTEEFKSAVSAERRRELKEKDRLDAVRALATFADIDPTDLIEVFDSLQYPEHREVAIRLISGAY